MKTAVRIDFNDLISKPGFDFYGSGDMGSTVFNDTPGVMSDFTFSPANPLATPSPLITIVSGASTFSFNLTHFTSVTQTANSIAVYGTGILHGTGYADTAADWVMSANKTGTATYMWSGSISAEGQPVPEPATMLLLGTGLVGLAGVGRKKANKA